MSAQEPGGKHDPEAKVESGRLGQRWEVPDLIEGAPRAEGVSRGPRLAADSARPESKLRAEPSGLFDEEEESSVELELDLPPSPAGSHEREPARGSQRLGMSGVHEPVTASVPAEPGDTSADRSPSRHTFPSGLQPSSARATAGAGSAFLRRYWSALGLLVLALLLTLGTCAYSAVSGEETNTGGLAGLLLLGSVVLFARRWWSNSQRR